MREKRCRREKADREWLGRFSTGALLRYRGRSKHGRVEALRGRLTATQAQAAACLSPVPHPIQLGVEAQETHIPVLPLDIAIQAWQCALTPGRGLECCIPTHAAVGQVTPHCTCV